MRLRTARFLALILTISFITGSVGTSALASETSSVSTDIVMDENSADTDAVQDEGESSGSANAENTDVEEAKDPESSKDSETEGSEENVQESAVQEPAEGAGSETEEAPEKEQEEAQEDAVAEPEENGDGGTAETAVENADEENGSADPAGSGEEAEAAEAAGDEDSADEPVKAEAAEAETGAEEAPEAPEAAEETETSEAEEILETQEASKKAEASVETKTELAVSASKASVYEGKTLALTATVTYTAASKEEAQKLSKSIAWSVGNNKTAPLMTIGTASVTASQISVSSGDSGESATGVTGTITQKVTVKGASEGTTVVTVSVGSAKKTCTVTVKPVPVKLGKSSNLRWTDTTILRWDAVSNAKRYKVTVSLVNGSKVYTKTVTVDGNTYVDLESQINALVKKNKSSIKGASFKITGSVQAISTDTAHYKNGAVAAAPSFRYLKTSYQECLKRNGWYMRGGSWYFYDAGVMKTGWLTFQGKRYYLGKDGAMRSSCWIGKKYLKSNGEMARGEWVDDYRYFVNSSGNKVAGKVFSTKNWVKTKKGWRYKKNGKYLKNTWKKIGYRTYYFDKNGFVKTGWLTQDGNKYYLNKADDISSGYGALCTGWKNIGKYTYWFDDEGTMLKSSWVDKNQYYVNSKGHKLSWITYANLRNVSTSNRLGYYVYSKETPPEQSIASYDLAYKKGNRIMVVDLRFTKDNVPVCFHDDDVKYARLEDGSVPAKAPLVSKMTLAQLQKYDYGISKGEIYKGTGLVRLEDMAKWIKNHPGTEMYIEVKVSAMSAAQIRKTTALLKKYKVTDRSSMIFAVRDASDTRAQRVHKAAPTLRIGITTSGIGKIAYSQIARTKGDSNEVFLWCWMRSTLSSSSVKKLRSKDVQFEFGTVDDFDDILTYFARGSSFIYTSGIETEGAVFKKGLTAATFHDKAQWEKVGSGWMYRQIDGTYARSKWITVSGKKYYVDKKGLMRTGWLNLKGKLYYLGSNGAMVTGTKTIAGHKYKFDENGAMVKKIK